MWHMKLIWLFLPILIATSCPRQQKNEKDPAAEESVEKESTRFRELVQSDLSPKKSVHKDEKTILSEALFSAAMIEAEIFKLIRPEFEQRTTPFQVISAAFDIASGQPTKFKLSDCKLWKTKKLNESRVEYLQNCVSPGSDFFSIEKKTEETWKILFKSSQWGAYLGPAVALTAADRDCLLQTKEGRLQIFECQNTVLGYQPENSATAVYELRLSQFQVRVGAQNPVEITGGFFKDLVEYRKLSMIVPKEGKIKITEKALKVRDDFAHLLKDQSTEVVEAPAASLDNSPKEGQVQNENQKENQKENNDEARSFEEGRIPENQNTQESQIESSPENFEGGETKSESSKTEQNQKQPIRRGR